MQDQAKRSVSAGQPTLARLGDDYTSQPERELNSKSKDNSVAILSFFDGDAGQIETWFEESTGYRIDCFVLESQAPFTVDAAKENSRRVSQRVVYPANGLYKGRPFIVAMDWMEQLKDRGVRKVLPITPDSRTRFRQINQLLANGFELVSAIHPSVMVLADAIINPGVWINAGALVGYRTELEPGVIINTKAQLDHHNVLKRCSTVDPGVVTAGFVTLWECSRIHTNATLINRIEVGADAIVGAGAVVIQNVPPACTVVGVPAKVVKWHDTHKPHTPNEPNGRD